MHHGVDVRTHPVDFRMDVELQRGLGVAFQQPPVEIDGDDVGRGERRPDRGPRVDVEGVGITPNTAMAAVIEDLGMLEHANGIRDRLLRGTHALDHFHGITDT